FKDQSTAIRAWGKDYGNQVKRSEAQLLEFLALSQDTFVPLGFDRREAAELSKTVTKLAIDLGSFKNIDDGESLRRLLGGLVGNTENLKAFGVQASAAAIKAQALTMGFDPSNLTSYQKALAILEITLQGTQDAQGDALRTSDEYVNSVKGLKSELKRLSIAIGAALIEPMTAAVRGVTWLVSKINDLLEAFPVFSQLGAGVAVVLTGIGAAAAAVGTAIALIGTQLTAMGAIALVQLSGVGGVLGMLTKGISSAAAMIRGLAFKAVIAGIGTALKGLMAGIMTGAKFLFSFLTSMAARLAVVLVNPWTLLIVAITAAMKLAERYYQRQLEKEKKIGDELEKQRQAKMAEYYRSEGLPVPADLSNNKDFNKARVVPTPTAAAPELDLELANEIRSMQTALQEYRGRIQSAQRLLEAGKITRAEFGKFAKQETDEFRKNDPTNQARESLREQLMTPIEVFNKSVTDAARLFANEPAMFRRAKEAAIEQFKANNAAAQMAKQLRTPLERYQDAIKEARELFKNDPENLRRALAAAADAFRASSPVEQLKDSLKTPAEVFRDRMAEIAKIVQQAAPDLRDGLKARAVAKAREDFAASDPDTIAARQIRDENKTDNERFAEKLREAVELVNKGVLSREELTKYRKNLLDEQLGERPESERFKMLQTTSAMVASQIGAFAPTFDNDDRALEYQREQRDLLRVTNQELGKLNTKRGRFR
ncbi:MAG: hypothetical protein ACF8AM_14300, partial [Rhodopirellula sp. JB055]|uniref:hypothetical protein n=1 Tax=Rhodopirellula sp. JB055 TaxID=3342846 RepID=UPI00370CD952